ncbi:MAG: cytochrome c biogenesis protein ResB [Phycisphaerales bacterium]|nr:MAG: cytochrome c biogenesis protein ResB [Phycisphaerales bacterium]
MTQISTEADVGSRVSTEEHARARGRFIVMAALHALASLRLTVALLAMSMVLILAGTLAQMHDGVWTVVHEYFRSTHTWIRLRLFVPDSWGVSDRVAILFPGGLTIGVLLFVNLVAAHAVRFKLSAKRVGIIVTHLGVILLLAGEFVTGAFADEGNMSIDEGKSSNFVEDIRTAELAVIDKTDPTSDIVIAIPMAQLHEGATIRHPMLGFEIHVDSWMANSTLAAVTGGMDGDPRLSMGPTADMGIGRNVRARGVARATGVDGSTVDVPSAYVTLMDGDRRLGTMMVSVHLEPEQSFGVGGKSYAMALRFKRTYKPYTLELIDFKHDLYVGTNRPKNFSSLVRLIDPEHHVNREVMIRMNEPLRYRGDTLYQASFKSDNSGTVLQVVRNPGWLLPYVSCGLVVSGMLFHFGYRSWSKRRGGAVRRGDGMEGTR